MTPIDYMYSLHCSPCILTSARHHAHHYSCYVYVLWMSSHWRKAQEHLNKTAVMDSGSCVLHLPDSADNVVPLS